MLYIIKPKEFWEKQVASFSFKLNKDRLRYKVSNGHNNILKYYDITVLCQNIVKSYIMKNI